MYIGIAHISIFKFVSKYIATIGVDFGVKSVQNARVSPHEVKVHLWDLSGHAEFAQVRAQFYSQTQAVSLSFSFLLSFSPSIYAYMKTYMCMFC